MYEPFYHLSGKPFQLSPDPSFFYESRVHRRAYAYLELVKTPSLERPTAQRG